jgi:thiamine pyrophosphokinase
MRAVVMGGGDLEDLERAREWVAAADLLIAADGGARHSLALGRLPDVLLGDFDSIAPGLLQSLKEDVDRVITYEAHKDETDLELALLYAKDAGASEITVLGAVGTRWDQSLASLLLPAHPDLRGLEIVFRDGNQRLFLIDSETEITGTAGELVSLIPIGGDARGVSSAGLSYPLADETLRFGTSRGLSNELLGERATVDLKAGLLLCVVGAPAETI